MRMWREREREERVEGGRKRNREIETGSGELRKVILERPSGMKTIKPRSLFICASPARLVDENTKCQWG